MRFQFDPGQQHQIRAVDAVADLFDGQMKTLPCYREFSLDAGAFLPSYNAVPNDLSLTEDKLLANLRVVQARHNADSDSLILMDDALSFISHQFSGDNGEDQLAGESARFANFSVEMETGTGKTFVYLRTIRELVRRYGWLKFIVVVPSVAVREGVLAALAATKEHFAEYYTEHCHWFRYDSDRLDRVRDFADADTARIMVMTMASFSSSLNVIHNPTDNLQGDTPLLLLRATRPILILDEPQNMESELSKEALARLNPLFALRYSATHREAYNLVYRMSPYDAYEKRLVKRVYVDEIKLEDYGKPYIRLIKVKAMTRGNHQAVLAIKTRTPGGMLTEKRITAIRWQRLDEKSTLPQYEALEVNEIISSPPEVEFGFTDGRHESFALREGGSVGDNKPAIFRAQIRATIAEHFSRQRHLKARGIKVLSLFFIDKVDNYIGEDGIIRRIFEECFDAEKKRTDKAEGWQSLDAKKVHAGYFSKGGGASERDAAAYQLIMRDKESLLTFPGATDNDETRAKREVAFIFTHSALREGWDNPNIFQICTLNESVSKMRKRQEIGRGVRIAVDQQGERVFDDGVNLLTVIANQSYAEYIADYQSEIDAEYREMIRAKTGKRLEDLSRAERAEFERVYPKALLGMSPAKKKNRLAKPNPAHLKKNGKFSPAFRELWERISQKTQYRLTIKTAKLVKAVVAEMKKIEIPQLAVTQRRAEINIAKNRFEAVGISVTRTIGSVAGGDDFIDVVALTSKMLRQSGSPVQITGKTLFKILSKDATRARHNPIFWANTAAQVIRAELSAMRDVGIIYEKMDGEFHEWEQHFADAESVPLLGQYAAKMPKGNKNAIYNLIDCDAKTEVAFADALANLRDVKLFVKLPRWFTVPTPAGNYNPDWAILYGDGNGVKKVVFVAETKSQVNRSGGVQWNKLRGEERVKIECAARHFGSKQLNIPGVLEDGGVDYKVVSNAAQLKAGD